MIVLINVGLCVTMFEEMCLLELFKLLIDLFYENVVKLLLGLHKKVKLAFKKSYVHWTNLIYYILFVRPNSALGQEVGSNYHQTRNVERASNYV